MLGRRHVAGTVVVLLAVLASNPEATAAGLTFEAILKAGFEGDTNPRRLNGEGSDSDTVERLFAELNLTSADTSQVVSGGVRIGAKRFNHTEEEDALVVDGAATFHRRLWRDLSLYARFSARDRTERGHIRDYVRLGLRGGLSFRPASLALSAGPGVDYFLYRPNSQLSYVAPVAWTQLSWAALDELVFSASYSYGHREYRERQLLEQPLVFLTLGSAAREDRTHLASFTTAYEGIFLTALELSWQRNLSNSFGKSFSRLTGRLSATLGLPLDLYLTGQISIQRTLFDDEVLIDPTVAIDDENRNSFVTALSGDIVAWLGWEIRYSYYTQEFGGDDADYRRHLIYGGLVAMARNE